MKLRSISQSARKIFSDHLARQAEGEEVDLDTLLAEHSDHAEGLRELHSRWLEASDLMRMLEAPAARGQSEAGSVTDHSPKDTEHAKSDPLSPRIHEGSVIGDYQLVKLLGRGGMGQVWEAQQVSLNRRVALKLLLPDRVDARTLEFFEREARAGGRLSHAGIVAVYGAGFQGSLAWLAMELVPDGHDLRSAIDAFRSEKQLPGNYYEHVAELVAQIADALEYAHAEGILHRDLKPANVLIGQDDRPKVADFGLAKVVDENSLSQVGELVGTWFYMSPEQLSAKRIRLDKRSDIFSLGVMFYELLTLTRPFDGDTTQQVAQQILNSDPADPRTLRSRVPEDLAVICQKALEKDRDRRYVSMGALAADLRRHLANEPILAKPPTSLERAIKWARRHPAKSMGGMIAAASMVVITTLGVIALNKADEADEQRKLAELSAAQAEESAQQARHNAEEAQEQRSQALAHAREAESNLRRAERETRMALEATELLGSVFSSPRPGVRGKDVLAVDLLDEASERLSDQFDENPALASQMHGMLAKSFFTLGRLEKAHEHVLKGSQVPGLLEADPCKASLAYHFLSTIHRARGERELALEAVFEAKRLHDEFCSDDRVQASFLSADIAMLQESEQAVDDALGVYVVLASRLLGEQPKPLRARFERILGEISLLWRNDRHEEAVAMVLEEAKPVSSIPGMERNLSEALSWIAFHKARYGDFDIAVPCAYASLQNAVEVAGERSAWSLSIEARLGAVLLEAGLLEQAEATLQRNLKSCREHLGDDHGTTHYSLRLLARLRCARGQNDDALALFEELERLKGKTGEKSGSLVLRSDLALALQGSEEYEEATALLRLNIAEQTGRRGFRNRIGEGLDDDRFRLASLLVQSGGHGEARELLTELIEHNKDKRGWTPYELSRLKSLRALTASGLGERTGVQSELEQSYLQLRGAAGEHHPHAVAAHAALIEHLRAIGNEADLLRWQER